MLIDFFRVTMQQWWCQQRNVGALRKKDIIGYAEKVIKRRINKSSVFRAISHMKNGIVNLESRWCTYRKWKLFGILWYDVMSVFKELRYQHCNT
uniref:Uncharacterized protein n=1 Tax=Lactuca sativa TaxID=4236 RepID=A0A9R1W788_LACSA|nr:hypothetical protein LSAT_V11C300139520 [Lactuca sativa]